METFDREAFARLARAEPGHFWFEERRDLIAWAVQRHAPAARTFCEVGCGTGFVLAGLAARFPHLALTGLEPYAEAFGHAAPRLSGVRLLHGGIFDHGLTETFDVVGCFDVLEHLPDDHAALQRLAELVRPGGGLILTVPQHPRLWSAADEIGHHQRRYTRRDLHAKLAAAGLVPRRTTSFVSFLLPVLWSRRRAALTREQALAELHPSRAANTFGRLLLRVERRLIAAGLSFPWGGSLLVVATKPAAQ